MVRNRRERDEDRVAPGGLNAASMMSNIHNWLPFAFDRPIMSTTPC